MKIENFNLRVYGLMLCDSKVLITHEHRAGIIMTKFPGGGLEKGEGLADGLMREFQEELAVAISIGDFFYVNEFLQVSTFNPKDQLLSFYYFVSCDSEFITVNGNEKVSLIKDEQIFEWVEIKDLRESDFTFPIDRFVVGRLKKSLS